MIPRDFTLLRRGLGGGVRPPTGGLGVSPQLRVFGKSMEG